jgi:hypothetical protein
MIEMKVEFNGRSINCIECQAELRETIMEVGIVEIVNIEGVDISITTDAMTCPYCEHQADARFMRLLDHEQFEVIYV